MAVIPHFDFPLKFQSGRAKVVQQDSDDDIANCVQVALLTPRGSRLYVPNFGVDDLVFSTPNTAQKSKLIAQLTDSEPRASISVIVGVIDKNLTEPITVGVGNVG